jgi:hypothetical protein
MSVKAYYVARSIDITQLYKKDTTLSVVRSMVFNGDYLRRRPEL